MRKIKSTNPIIYLSIISLGIFLAAIFIQKTESRNTSGNKKIKPLITIEDANRPNLNYDGTRVVVGPKIGLDEVFDVDTGKLLGSYEIEESHTAILSPDGKRVRIFYDFHKTKGTFDIDPYQTTFEIDTGKMLSKGKTDVYKDGEFLIFTSVNPNGPDTSRNYTSDLTTVAASYRIYPKESNKPDQPTIIVGNIENHTLVCELYSDDGYVHRDEWDETTMTPDGKFVVSSRFNFNDNSRNRTVVWDVEKRKIILKLPFKCTWLSISADGKRLVTRDRKEGGQIETWDVMTGKKISTLAEMVKGQNFSIGHGIILPDGKTLVTTGVREILFWDIETGKRIASQDQSKYSGGMVKSLGFSGDGKRIAIGSDTEIVTVWSVDEILKNEKQTLAEE